MGGGVGSQNFLWLKVLPGLLTKPNQTKSLKIFLDTLTAGWLGGWVANCDYITKLSYLAELGNVNKLDKKIEAFAQKLNLFIKKIHLLL